MRNLPIAFIGMTLAVTAHGQVTTWSDQVVAGTPNDLMIVRHLVIRGDNVSIGKKLAELARSRHHSELLALPDPKVVPIQAKWLRTNYPERYARAQGVRSVYGLSAKSPYDATFLPVDMKLKPACSVVYYPDSSVTNGHAMMSRNYDFPKATYAQIVNAKGDPKARSMTGDPYVIEMYPDKGYASLYVCAYDLEGAAIDGVNSKGVTVALLADDMTKNHKRGRPGYGLGEADIPRYVLDRCASAKQARRLLKNVPYFTMFGACHYIVGDSTSDSFVFEVGPDGKHFIIDGNRKPQIVTNHSIAEYGTTNLPKGDSFDRYKKLQAEFAKHAGKLTPNDVKVVNSCVAVPESVMVSGTLWQAVYDTRDRSVNVSFCLSRADEAKERRTPYLHFQLKSAWAH